MILFNVNLIGKPTCTSFTRVSFIAQQQTQSRP